MKIKIATILVAVLFTHLLYSQVNTQWISRFNSSGNNNDVPVKTVIDNDGNIIVAGYSVNSRNDQDYMVVKFNSSGEELWKSFFDGRGNKIDQVNGVTYDSKGFTYLTGASVNENGDYDMVTIKLDNKGEQVWVSTFNGPEKGDDGATSIVIDTEENIYICGYVGVSKESIDIYTIKYDGKTGDKVWTAVFDNPINDVDYPVAMAIDADNNIYIGGYSHFITNSGNDFLLIKYTLNGAKIWAKTYGNKGDDKVSAISLDKIGNIYLTGISSGDYSTVKYTPSGDLVWDAKYDGPAGNFDQPNTIAVDNTGNVYISGRSQGSGTGTDYATIKYNPDGVELWVARFNDQGNSDDEASNIAIDNLGSVYVTGNTWNGSNNDYITIKYNPLGSELWISRYNGPGNQVDKAISVAVDKMGNVLVSGLSIGTGSQYDVALIRYSQSAPEVIPQLVAPAYGASGILQSPSLEWTPIKNADFCRLQVSLDKNFKTIIVDTNVTVAASLCKIPERILENNTQYFWRLASGNVAGYGQWSQTWTFSVLNAPDSPQPLSPQNGAAGQTVTPTLIWQKSSTAETYRLQVSKDINFTEILHDINSLTTNEYTLPGGLLTNNSQYFWRVNASNAGGTVPWSNTWSLGTGFVNPPQQPELISLPNGALGQSLTPTLDWNDQHSVTTYRIQIASDLNFTNIVVDEGNLPSSNFTVSAGKLQPKTTYYWKIGGTNLGGTGNWSHIWTFTTMGTGIEKIGKDLPIDLFLYKNDPDPFSSITTIRFDVPNTYDNSQVSISVFDEMGKEVSVILDEKVKAGKWRVQWDGSNFPRGYYLYQIRTKGFVQTKKMFLVK